MTTLRDPAKSQRSTADETSSPSILRLALWSGPRNISTAMMRSFDARDDTVVCDEPLYARWLLATGAAHPGRDEIIANGETDLARIIQSLTRDPLPAGKTIFYQKHMAHHLLERDELAWTDALTNALLIREPARVIASYVKVVPNPALRDLGYAQQVELLERERDRLGATPPVLDAADVLRNPRAMLTRLCEMVGAPFKETMLAWEKGSRHTDGVWAKHWYHNVYESTGFAPAVPPASSKQTLARRHTPLVRACESFYETLRQARIVSDD